MGAAGGDVGSCQVGHASGRDAAAQRALAQQPSCHVRGTPHSALTNTTPGWCKAAKHYWCASNRDCCLAMSFMRSRSERRARPLPVPAPASTGRPSPVASGSGCGTGGAAGATRAGGMNGGRSEANSASNSDAPARASFAPTTCVASASKGRGGNRGARHLLDIQKRALGQARQGQRAAAHLGQRLVFRGW